MSWYRQLLASVSVGLARKPPPPPRPPLSPRKKVHHQAPVEGRTGSSFLGRCEVHSPTQPVGGLLEAEREAEPEAERGDAGGWCARALCCCGPWGCCWPSASWCLTRRCDSEPLSRPVRWRRSAALHPTRVRVWKADPRQQDWILKCVQVWRTHPLAACAVRPLTRRRASHPFALGAQEGDGKRHATATDISASKV
jgi:hypothetical protein